MGKYFINCNCIEEVKAEYKRLAMENHPDLGGDTTTMQEINNEYEKAFNIFKNQYRSSTGETYTSSTETTETATEFMEIINKLINCKGIKVELIGRWIWVSGETKEYKDILNSLNFKWCNNKKMWSWHKPEDKKKSRKNYGIDEIRSKFGSKEFYNKTHTQITA